MSDRPHLVLASASPRRRELLAQIGLLCDVRPADIDETPWPRELPEAYVERLAIAKASAVADALLLETDLNLPVYIIGSDTSVITGDEILGKPTCEQNFVAMMERLSGVRHQVMTAFSVIKLSKTSEGMNREQRSQVVTTDVWFRHLSIRDIRQYWHSSEPHDKAGGYGIQGLGGMFVSKIEGSYSNVVGMPLTELALVLDDMGYDVWQNNSQIAKQ